MPESDEFFKEFKRLQYKVDAMEYALRLSLQAIPPYALLQRATEVLRRPKRANIFLAVDGVRIEKEIHAHLASMGISTSLPTICRALKELETVGLIKPVPANGRGKVYARTFLDQIFDFTGKLQRGEPLEWQ